MKSIHQNSIYTDSIPFKNNTEVKTLELYLQLAKKRRSSFLEFVYIVKISKKRMK